jgi:hypothetical protein
MNSKRKKIGLNRKLDAFASVESRSIAAPSPHPEAVHKTRFSEAAENAIRSVDSPTPATPRSSDSQAVNKSLSSSLHNVDSPKPTTPRSSESDSPVVNKSLTRSELSDRASKAYEKWMKEVSGTDEKPLQDRLLDQATRAVTDYVGRPIENMEYAAAAMHAIKPQDGLEGLLAAQMVGMHTLAMEFGFRAALKDQTDLGVEVNLNRAVKASEAFAKLTEALSRYRGKGEQKMTVEHVHVHKGGQAIVGAVSQSNTQNNTKVRSSGDDSK